MTSFWLEVTIVHVNCGILPQEIQSILSKGIKTLFIVWLLIFLLVIKFVQVPLIILPKYGALLLVNNYQLLMDIQEKSLPYHSILMEFWWEQDQWIVQPNFGMLKWVKYIQLWKVIKENLFHCISMPMETWFWQVLLIKLLSFGMPELVNQFIVYKDIPKKLVVHCFNSLGSIAQLGQSMELVNFGMWDREHALKLFKVMMVKFSILLLMQQELN